MKKKFSLRTQITLIVVIFVVAILGTMYIFQTTFLDEFYKKNKIANMEKISQNITKNLENENLQDVLYKQTLSEDVCIRIISGTINVVGYTQNNACALGSLTDYQINRLYYEIENNNHHKLFDNYSFEAYPGRKDNIYIYGETKLINQEKVMVLVSSTIVPLQATKDTLTDQFKLIMLIVILATIVLAFVISKLIIKPIKQIEQEAKNLPNGQYNKDNIKTSSEELDSLNNTLSASNEDINKADKTKKELIANVSHDLRTPLTMIVGYGEMIKDFPEENNEENIDVIIDEAKRLSLLVNDLLDISKASNASINLCKKDVSLNKLLKDVYRQYSPYCKKNKISFKLKTADDVIVNIDVQRIKQVLYNFINNAINYNNKKEKIIVLGSEKIEDTYRVYVYDNGEGISKENIKNIWDRYYKVDKQHKRSTLGSGIGLSLSKELLIAHDLNCGVESKINEYSKFYFDIKVA